MQRLFFGFGALGLLLASVNAAAQAQTLLLRDPAISAQHIAFVYAGDLWVADRDGANPRRLTSSPADEYDPQFSPDGQTIAFGANYDSNRDVFTIPTAGGQPKRLTWHPGSDTVIDWHPDGDAVAFVSRRETAHGRSAQLFHVATDGGLPQKQMEARIFRGRYDDSGNRLAYMAHGPAYNGLYGGSSGWRGYRGGTSPSIIVMDIEAQQTQEIPGERVNDIEPMWVGDQVYFVSDRDNKVFNLHRFDPATGQIQRVTNEATWDIRAADAHGNQVIFETGGRLKRYDAGSGETTEIAINIAPDLPQLRPQWKNAANNVESWSLSPNGKRVAITARGEVFTVPIKDGSTRNLTNSDDRRQYTAIWSNDGQQIAYVDASQSSQELVIVDQTGTNQATRWSLGEGDFNFLHDWADGGQTIVYQNHRLQLYAINTSTGRKTLIATGARRDQIEADVAPGGRWLAYTREQPNFNRELFLYDFEDGRSYPVSNNMADTSSPAFSPDGKYLFFAASTNSGPAQVGLDMSSQERPYRAALYALVLSNDAPSPLQPETGDETDEPDNDGDQNEDKDKGDEPNTIVDLDGLAGRIVALPVAARNYSDLAVAKDGTLYFVQSVQAGAFDTAPEQRAADENQLLRFDFEDKEVTQALSGVTAADISNNGNQLLIQLADGSLQAAEVGEKLEPKPLDMSGVKLFITPRDEWQQIFDETWRMQQAYFYDPAMHGIDWDAIYERYQPLVNHVGRREDLSALLTEMIAELHVGHNRTGGGDVHRESAVSTGLLGADIYQDNGRHRIGKIYTGEQWNPYLDAPLAQPGMKVKTGDYILAVNGRELGTGDNLFAFLQGTVGEQVTLRIATNPRGRDARDVIVEPTASESALRLWSWVEANRQAVSDATDGKVGYVYLPNTTTAGYTFFNRMFFAQVDKQGMIIDERSNGGGQAANYITDVLSRTYLSGWKDRDGLVFETPGGAMYGPKVMLIDQDAGSGGDFLPYSFKRMQIGPLIGKRTWGGLIGISANPRLIDGGFLTVPFFRFFDPDGNWSIENEGVAPDIDVSLDPIATNRGRDTQLERAIKEVNDRLERHEPLRREAPPYPTELGR